MSERDNNSRQSAYASVVLSNELLACCVSDTISEEGIREIIERRGLTPNNRDVSNHQFFHMACCNEEVTEGIIRCLLEYFPDAISDADSNGHLPLHAACGLNKNVRIDIIQLLIDAAPDSVRHEDNNGLMALHHLCGHRKVDETIASAIFKLLLEKHPDAIRHANSEGRLPIHVASMMSRSSEFCRVLIEAYPGSEQISDEDDRLPIHFACTYNTAATVEYLYGLYPDAINHMTTEEMYPIHLAISGLSKRADPGAAVDIVKFLLGCDPNVILQKIYGAVPLIGWAYILDHNDNYDDTNVGAAIEVMGVIYDAHPEAIENEAIVSNILDRHPQVQEFIINNQLVYSHQSRDHRLMTTPDGNGQLPLHKKLQNNARLG